MKAIDINYWVLLLGFIVGGLAVDNFSVSIIACLLLTIDVNFEAIISGGEDELKR